MKRKHYGWSALAGLLATLFVAASMVSGSAAAAQTPSPSPDVTPTAPAPVCPTWKFRSITGSDWLETPAEGSEVVSKTRAILTKPEGGGTEFATMNAGLDYEDEVDITVSYFTSGGASHSDGAIRLFYYEDVNANTLTTGPTKFIEATAGSGILKIEGVTKVGTLGVVYDASNSYGGSVTFTNLKVGDTEVFFRRGACKAPPTTAPPTTAPPTSEPPVTKSPTPVPGVAGGDEELPVTGPKMAIAAAFGGTLILGGLVLFFAARRRRQTRFVS